MKGQIRTFKIASTAMLLQTLCVLFTATFVVACGQQDSSPQAEVKGVALGQLSVGESGVQYANLNTTEMLPVGPSGIFSMKDGYAISDIVGGKIFLLDDNFDVQRTIDVRAAAQGIIAIAQDGNDVVALDGAAATPKLLRITAEGTVHSIEIRMEAETPPTGLKSDDDGLILEYGGGESLYRVSDDGSLATLDAVDGYTWNGKSFSVSKSTDPKHHERVVLVGERSVQVRVPNYLGSVQIVGPDAADGVYVLVEDVKMTDMVSVEQSVWHLDADGKVVSIAIVPIEKRVTGVGHGVAIAVDGEPVAMITKPEALQFWKLKEHPSSMILDREPVDLTGVTSIKGEEVGVTRSSLITYSGSCLTSSQMQSNAQEYLNVSQSMSSNNINNNGTCTTRTKPNYLGSAGTYSSVSYDWGGWDTPSAFQSAMNAGGKAGNLNTAGGLSCSYGVDCSGFLTRVWGFTNWKRSTNDVPNANTSSGPSYGPAYLKGDAFNKVGVHVVLYVSNAANGLNLWEASGEPYARVVYRFSNWSYLSGYSSWRSLTSCNF